MNRYTTLFLWAICLVGFFARALLILGILYVVGGDPFVEGFGGSDAFWVLLGCLLFLIALFLITARSKNHL